MRSESPTMNVESPGSTPHTSLYICYQSVLDPLTHTQVIAYLHGLAEAGHRILLLTYETRSLSTEQRRDMQQQLAAKGIQEWHVLRYHRRPTLLATLWDMLAGLYLTLRLWRRHQLTLIHARSHVPGMIGFWMKKLTGVRLLFDCRGLMAEEYADAGVWPKDGMLFRLTKHAERLLLRNSDAVVVLTEKVREELIRSIDIRPAVQVIPCCVDCSAFDAQQPTAAAGPNDPYMLYVGKLGGWYPTAQMVEFFAAAREVIPDLKWKILTQRPDEALGSLLTQHGLTAEVEVGAVPADELPQAMRGALFALCLYDRDLSASACSPTKVGEYLAAGVPVIASAAVGDLEELLQGADPGNRVGVVVSDLGRDAWRDAVRELQRLREQSGLAEACRLRAREQLDLTSVGWPRYQHVYQTLGA